MRRIFVVSFMLAALVVPLQAQTPYLINTNDYQLDSVSGINSNFVFLFGSGTNAFRTAVEKGSNINFVGKSPTNATQLDYCFTNTTADGNTPQGPWTNSVGGAGFALTGADYAQFTNQTFVRVGTNLLSAQGWPNVTNVAWNGASLINPATASTPQGPWTNVVSMNGFAGTGGDYLQVTNQIAFRVGTNLLAVQGWPDATNIAWNGAALINVSGSGGGGAYAYQGTNNVLMTNANGNTINAAAIATIISGGASNTIGTAANAAILSGKNNVISNQGTAYSCAVIAGGSGNIIGGDPSEPGWFGFIGAGLNNKMHGDRSSIVGGEGNIIGDQSFYSTIAYGQNNTMGAGASYNVAGGQNSTIGAGSSYNVALGEQSIIGASIARNTISGGGVNQIYNPADYATISGGGANEVVADYGTVGGGQINSVGAGATHGTVGGGYDNDIGASATYATVGGGQTNKIAASAIGATIPGGIGNMVDAPYGFAAGKSAQAAHASAFVWADNQGAQFVSTATNQFLIRASGGVRVAQFGGGQDTNTWAVTGLKIVTNANVFLYAPAWQGSQLLDVGSNRIYYAVGLTTNDWKGTNLN